MNGGEDRLDREARRVDHDLGIGAITASGSGTKYGMDALSPLVQRILNR